MNLLLNVRIVAYMRANIEEHIRYAYAFVRIRKNVGHNTRINGHTHIVHVVRKENERRRKRARVISLSSLDGQTIELVSKPAIKWMSNHTTRTSTRTETVGNLMCALVFCEYLFNIFSFIFIFFGCYCNVFMLLKSRKIEREREMEKGLCNRK